MSTLAAVIGRICIAMLFIVSGGNKLVNTAPTEAAMAAVGLPAGFAIAVGLFEIAAGLCLAVGFMTRIAAILLAGFTGLAILFFHNRFNEPEVAMAALIHLALIGGLLLVFAHSQIWWSYDNMRRTRRVELNDRTTEDRARDAEVRAARAEGRAEALAPEPPRRKWF